jgi:tetratricopeptide (TPR) repeat protein
MRGTKLVAVLFIPSWFLAVAAEAPTQADIQSLLDQRKYSEAEQILVEELRQRPQWEEGQVLLGRVCNSIGRYSLAEQSAYAALKIRPSVDAYLVLATAAFNQRKLNQSIESLEKAANLQPENAVVYRILGLNYALGGMPKDSAAAFARFAKLEPANWESHYLYGRSLYELQRFPASASELRQALALNPGSPKVLTALGQTQEMLDQFADAEAAYRKAADHCTHGTEDCSWPLLQLGTLLIRQEGPEHAEPILKQAVADRPTWDKPHFQLGKAQAEMHDFVHAKREFETAIQLNESVPQYHYQLSRACRELGEREQADKEMARFRALRSEQRNAVRPTEIDVQ